MVWWRGSVPSMTLKGFHGPSMMYAETTLPGCTADAYTVDAATAYHGIICY